MAQNLLRDVIERARKMADAGGDKEVIGVRGQIMVQLHFLAMQLHRHFDEAFDKFVVVGVAARWCGEDVTVKHLRLLGKAYNLTIPEHYSAERIAFDDGPAIVAGHLLREGSALTEVLCAVRDDCGGLDETVEAIVATKHVTGAPIVHESLVQALKEIGASPDATFDALVKAVHVEPMAAVRLMLACFDLSELVKLALERYGLKETVRFLWPAVDTGKLFDELRAMRQTPGNIIEACRDNGESAMSVWPVVKRHGGVVVYLHFYGDEAAVAAMAADGTLNADDVGDYIRQWVPVVRRVELLRQHYSRQGVWKAIGDEKGGHTAQDCNAMLDSYGAAAMIEDFGPEVVGEYLGHPKLTELVSEARKTGVRASAIIPLMGTFSIVVGRALREAGYTPRQVAKAAQSIGIKDDDVSRWDRKLADLFGRNVGDDLVAFWQGVSRRSENSLYPSRRREKPDVEESR